MKDKKLALVASVFEDCVNQYIHERRNRITDFVKNHFSFQQTIEIQKKYFFADFLYNPINAVWSIPYLSCKKIVEILDKLGWDRPQILFTRIPSGIKTGYQKEIENLIAYQILDYKESAKSAEIAFFETLKEQEIFSELIDSGSLSELFLQKEFQKVLTDYSASRMIISDLAGSLMTLFWGGMFFGDKTLSIFGLGDHLARKMARQKAASNFFLGKGVGSSFYKIFPPEPSLWQIGLSTLFVVSLLTIFSLGINLLSDPLRKKIGLQEKKLHALLDDLEINLLIQFKRRLKNCRQQKKVAS